MSFINEIKELADIIRQNKNWVINSIVNTIVTLYYSICFHLTKIAELLRNLYGALATLCGK